MRKFPYQMHLEQVAYFLIHWLMGWSSNAWWRLNHTLPSIAMKDKWKWSAFVPFGKEWYQGRIVLESIAYGDRKKPYPIEIVGVVVVNHGMNLRPNGRGYSYSKILKAKIIHAMPTFKRLSFRIIIIVKYWR